MISGPSSALVEPDLEFEDLPLRQARRRPDFVVRLGPKAFELSAGFLRIRDGDDPLDASGVHPEAYPVVRRILAATKSQLDSLIRNTPVLRRLEPEAFTDTVFGVPTVTAILRELEKPGRDPRPAYKTANSCEGVEKLEDLKPGMVLEGVVTNVAAFGGFVDVGVHQGGLVHISAMANAYVKDPRKIAKPGDVVRVKVLEVDPKRRRISLTMRLDQALEARPSTARAASDGRHRIEIGRRLGFSEPAPSRPSDLGQNEAPARGIPGLLRLATCVRGTIAKLLAVSYRKVLSNLLE